jgi:hypothetical protein
MAKSKMLQSFPLLALSLLAYAAFTFLSGSNPPTPWYDAESFNVHMNSGDIWHITTGHLFIGFSLVMLFIELLRATRSGRASIMNHGLSVVVFIGALMLFTTVRGYGNSIFFLFMAMTFTDFMVGFIITTATSRRDVAIGRTSE